MEMFNYARLLYIIDCFIIGTIETALGTLN